MTGPRKYVEYSNVIDHGSHSRYLHKATACVQCAAFIPEKATCGYQDTGVRATVTQGKQIGPDNVYQLNVQDPENKIVAFGRRPELSGLSCNLDRVPAVYSSGSQASDGRFACPRDNRT